MALIRLHRTLPNNWSPFEQLSRLRNEIDNLFAAPFSEAQRTGQFFNEWAPALDVYDDKENVYVKAEVPGMKKEEIDISLHDNVLTISGERKVETKNEDAENYRSERFFGRFTRSITLPIVVESDKVKASYKDGILTITLPKSEKAKPKQIEINVK
jgi:HSP20 family protein